MSARWVLVSALSVSLLYGCGGSTVVPSSTGAAGANPTIVGDDWITYAHDYKRDGMESQNVGLTTSNLSDLSLRWSINLQSPVYASPLVYQGTVYVATDGGVIYALNENTGAIIWQRSLGESIRMTPTIDPQSGLLFVGTHDVQGPVPEPSAFYALDLLKGDIVWQVAFPGVVHGEPVAAGGRVFIDVSGGDPPYCIQGGVWALNESSGATLWTWHVDQSASEGGGVWAPISYNGTSLIVGTGNTCQSPVSTANSVVALNPADGSLQWTFLAEPNSLDDDDTGGGELLYNGGAYFINKNGTFYGINGADGSEKFSTQLNTDDGYGGFFQPTTDGSTIIASGGTYLTPSATASAATRQDDTNPLDMWPIRHRSDASTGQYGNLVGMDFAGVIKWQIATQNPLPGGYVAIADGMAFATIDNTLTVLDPETGAKLWSYTSADLITGGPAVVPSGIYFADNSGDVYALGLSSSSASSSRRP